jgi:hypothetical protein
MGGSIYLILAFFFGVATAVVGRSKGSSATLWFLIGVIVPGIGLLVAFAYRNDGEEPRRECPRCGRVCMLHDALCVRCGAELDFTTEVGAAAR